MTPNEPEATILIVENSEITRKTLAHNLAGAGFSCLTAANGLEALEVMNREEIDLVLSDQEMPGMDGIELLRRIKETRPHLPFILLTGHGSVGNAVVSIKQGADDYLEKPCSTEVLAATIRRSLGYSRLRESNRRLRKHLCDTYCFHNIVTRSEGMRRILEFAARVARADNATVLIQGESGTGKEVLARAIHYSSSRMEYPFVAVNCAGIPVELFESELFGHVKGAFTGAVSDREGRLSQAEGGTILLDEIGDMPLDLQAKLLRVLEERTFEKVGSGKTIRADVRVIAATNRDLEEMVRRNAFREDLFYRINAFPITLPPLRRRREDIPILVEHFARRFSEQAGRKPVKVSPEAMELLAARPWPGNIRELKNCLERAVILAGDTIGPDDLLPPAGPGPDRNSGDMVEIRIPRDGLSLERVIDTALETALALCNGNKSRAADLLGVDRKMFYRRKVTPSRS